MEDYKEEIKKILNKYYSNSSNGSNPIYRNTYQMLNLFIGVIPQEPISEHDMFEVMKEEDFNYKIIEVEVKEPDTEQKEKGESKPKKVDKLVWELWKRPQ